LTVVGSHEANPAYADRAVDKATELGIADTVEFTGEVPESTLTALFEASDVLCVPSRYEGFGMVYLEAMEYGVVPIASSHGGAGEFIADGQNGFLVDPDDTERIAALLADLAANRDRLADLGVAALDTAAAHPSWEETLGEVRALLKRVSTASASTPVERTTTETHETTTDRGEQV
jgi:glycosyltransferase involved in cell wall biosynthesis